jgi:hypothetical protein
LTFTPELYACGVDIVGISHISTFMKSVPAYWRPLHYELLNRVGNAVKNETFNKVSLLVLKAPPSQCLSGAGEQQLRHLHGAGQSWAGTLHCRLLFRQQSHTLCCTAMLYRHTLCCTASSAVCCPECFACRPPLLQAISPYYHVDKIRAPLIIGQGANDVRVPQNQSDKMHQAMRARGLDVTYILYPGKPPTSPQWRLGGAILLSVMQTIGQLSSETSGW